MYGRSRVNLKIERGSTFTLCETFHTVHTASISFLRTHVNDETVEIQTRMACIVNR